MTVVFHGNTTIGYFYHDSHRSIGNFASLQLDALFVPNTFFAHRSCRAATSNYRSARHLVSGHYISLPKTIFMQAYFFRF